ncbi:hypothetical protein GCM10027610_004070 [Dactylosporangium cerinum]
MHVQLVGDVGGDGDAHQAALGDLDPAGRRGHLAFRDGDHDLLVEGRDGEGGADVGPAVGDTEAPGEATGAALVAGAPVVGAAAGESQPAVRNASRQAAATVDRAAGTKGAPGAAGLSGL